jgi:hypothetical protein
MKINNINIPNPRFIFVNQKSDLPSSSGGVITLVDNYTYYFTNSVDLAGDRIVCGQNTTILGASSENCTIYSTGLATALITSTYSLPMRNITLTANVALNLDGDNTVITTGTTAIDWFGVNFTNCPTVGTIKDYTNVIMTDCAFLNSANLTFDGAIGSVGLSTCLFDGTTGSTFILPATLTITRRFRVIYSSFVTLSGETSLNVNASSTIPNDAYILTYCNFSGGGTYLSGVTQSSLETLFINNIGITNTSNVGHYYMQNNATATATLVAGTFVKAPGTTIAGIGNSPKWTTATTNRLTYAGSVATDFIVTVVGSVIANTTISTLSVGISENGAQPAVESRVSVRCPTVSFPFAFSLQDVVQVTNGDFFEIWIANETGTTTAVLQDVNVIIQKVTG